MYRPIELKSRLVTSATMVLLASILLVLATDAREAANARKLTTPQGVRLLMNKTFDDSDQARKEILELYKDLRVTDVLDDVIVVPRQHALIVGNLAREINIGDEKSRAGRFKRLGIPLDESVKVE